MRSRLYLFACLTLAQCGAPEAPANAPPAAATAPTSASSLPTTDAHAAGPKPPETTKKPVVNVYHGTRVTDDYQWLENPSEPDVKRWEETQARHARTVLDAQPARTAIRDRVTQLLTSSSPDRFGLRHVAGKLFALKDQPPKQQPFLVVMRSADDPGTERVIVDPNEIDKTGRTTIDFYVPSHDGKKVAVSLSRGGSETGDVHVYEVATGKELGDVVPRVNGGTAGGSVAWISNGTGFYYTRYPREGERPPADLDFFQQVFFHKLGSKTSEDRYAVGKEFPRIAEVELETSDDGKWVLASVANGDGGEFSFWLLGPSGKWERFADNADQLVHAEFGQDNDLYAISRDGAPRGKVLRITPRSPNLKTAKVVVPESKAVIQSLEATRTRLYVVELVGGPTQVRALSTDGKALGDVPTPPVSSTRELVHVGGDDLLLRVQSFTTPPGWYRYGASDGKTTLTALHQTSAANFDDAEIVRETCTSKDGTSIPLSVLRRKGLKQDGSSPTLLSGYGGYNVSLTPRFNPIHRLWLDQGGVFAMANLRGGGEFGQEWHLAGNLTRKQNVFDDFAGCAKHLVDTRTTRPERLAIIGGSNGGLLMGAELTQHPDLFRAVVSYVGIYDMLRVELSPNGAFNVTEFGTVANPDHFKALYAYSPYHHVQNGTPYPAILFLTGANDPRVDPYHSRKMTARLQEATSSSHPVLLRPSGDTGHGGATPLSAEIDEDVDVYSFLFHELGVDYRPVASATKP